MQSSQEQRKKIGIALSGGGARGFAHIGVIKALAEHNIQIDIIAGTSAGAIVGGAFAAGMSIDEIIAMASKIGWTNMMRPSLSVLGLMSSSPMGQFIEREFPVRSFENMPIPFAAVACDFETGAPVILSETGSVSFAIRASCALPGIFEPVKDKENKLLIDGGVVSPMPVEVVRQMGADIVIGVDLMASGATFRARPLTAFGMMFQSAMMLLRSASRTQHNDADIIIVPAIGHLRPDQINKREEFITLGEAAGREKIDEIRSINA